MCASDDRGTYKNDLESDVLYLFYYSRGGDCLFPFTECGIRSKMVPFCSRSVDYSFSGSAGGLLRSRTGGEVGPFAVRRMPEGKVDYFTAGYTEGKLRNLMMLVR